VLLVLLLLDHGLLNLLVDGESGGLLLSSVSSFLVHRNGVLGELLRLRMSHGRERRLGGLGRRWKASLLLMAKGGWDGGEARVEVGSGARVKRGKSDGRGLRGDGMLGLQMSLGLGFVVVVGEMSGRGSGGEAGLMRLLVERVRGNERTANGRSRVRLLVLRRGVTGVAWEAVGIVLLVRCGRVLGVDGVAGRVRYVVWIEGGHWRNGRDPTSQASSGYQKVR
jgi:hypothetical protein